MIVLKILLSIMIVGAIIFTLFICFPLVRVEGDSMYPTLKQGKILLCTRLFNKNKCKVNKLYVIYLRDDEDSNPYYIIKRLKSACHPFLSKDTYYDFRGDNTEVSYDSRQHGLFHSKDVEFKVIGKFNNKAKGA